MHEPIATSTLGQRLAWALNDVANSAFALVIITAFYALHFREIVVGDGDADALWGLGIAISTAVVAISSPIMGAIADRRGWRKRLLFIYTVVGAATTIVMGQVGAGMWIAGLLVLVVANAAFEGSLVFYDSLLPSLVPDDQLGRWSGYGWAAGYLGSIGCLLGANALRAEGGFAAVALLVGVWWLAFSAPLFRKVREPPAAPVGEGGPGVFRGLAITLRRIAARPHLARFFLAFFLYTNGITTTLVFAAPFAQQTLAFTSDDIVTMLLMVQVAGAVGAFALGFVADRIGHGRTITLTLVIWCALVVVIYFVREKAAFYACALTIGFVMGATQSASRAFLATAVSEGDASELFGFKAICGKSSAVLGPLVFGLTSTLTGDQRLALLAVGTFFVAGLFLMLRVDEREAKLGD